MIGRKFGRLMVLEEAGCDKSGNPLYGCKCECGVYKIIRGQHLRAGTIKSCGCLNAEVAKERSTTHGMDGTPEHKTWEGMKGRCADPSAKSYGARGITVCDEWRHDFMAFLNHVGKKPSPKHTIERIKNDVGYEPGNVRWATSAEQCINRRLRSDNKTEINGVHLSGQKYYVQISVNLKKYRLGCFATLEEATIVRKQAEQKYWGGKCLK